MFTTLLTSLVFAFVIGCSDQGQPNPAPSPPAASNPNPVPPAPAPTASQPAGRIVFQPCFLWADGEETFQGTGFFAKSPDGQAVAITSAHFLNTTGPALQAAHWLDVRDNDTVATLTKSWGPPGRGSIVTLDYLIMPVTHRLDNATILELDDRDQPEKDELVWLPNKDDKQEVGHTWVTGKVHSPGPHSILVFLDTNITLQSQSGSPIISQRTGKVIGTLNSGSSVPYTGLFLTPARSLQKALQASDHPYLINVVGKEHRDDPARFNVPTLCGPTPPTKADEAKPGDADVAIHILNWRQMEFVPREDRNDADGLLRAAWQFKGRNWSDDDNLWTGTFHRAEFPLPIATRKITLASLHESFAVAQEPKRGLFFQSGQKSRLVEGGFALKVDKVGIIYGDVEGGFVTTLGFRLERNEPDSQHAATLLKAFATKHNLQLLDWYRTVSAPLENDSQLIEWIESWRIPARKEGDSPDANKSP